MESGTEIYLESLKAICPQLTKDELTLFASKVTLKELEKKAFFLQAGKTQKAIGFLTRGLVRSFYVDEGGK